MNNSYYLARNLRRFFGALRFLLAFVSFPAVLITIIVSFLPPASAKSSFIDLALDVRVTQSDDPTGKTNPLPENPDFRVRKLKADMRVNLRTADAALSKVLRYTVM